MTALSRRALLTGALLAGPALFGRRAGAAPGDEGLRQTLAALEHRHGGRLGVAVLDSASGRRITHRGDERFALCSTHKLLSAAFVLTRVDRGEESLSRRIVYRKADLVPYSPVTAEHADGEGLSLGVLCEAAMTLSDNTAANLLLDSFGGPAGLTAYLRAAGDGITRLDRREPALNEATSGDPQDTTTPVEMVEFLRQTILGTALSVSSRRQLTAWLIANKTGDKRLRAGVPQGWRVGDKTGTGKNGATNDVAVLFPPGRAPILVAAYYAEAPAADDQRDQVLSEVGRLAAAI